MNLKQQKIVRIIAAIIALILVFSLLISLVACSKKKDQATDADSSATQSDAGEETPGPVGDKIVNIGVTNVIGSLNPLLLDATEVNKYAISLMFLPLVDLDNNLDFVPQIASEITTEDNLTFTIKVNPEINWVDGEQVDANDVIFTLF